MRRYLHRVIGNAEVRKVAAYTGIPKYSRNLERNFDLRNKSLRYSREDAYRTVFWI